MIERKETARAGTITLTQCKVEHLNLHSERTVNSDEAEARGKREEVEVRGEACSVYAGCCIGVSGP